MMVERWSPAAGEKSPKATDCSIAGLLDDAEDGRDAIIHAGEKMRRKDHDSERCDSS